MAASRIEEPAARLVTPQARTGILCPACGSPDVAQVLGDNGGVTYVCTSCGHSWS
ncbi:MULTISPECIES: hypothetical protein [unclassified Streptomyces]|jgi:DNA-directed RNA polymerase subunit RPC12/RpoP|uniref:hypothetical protein n=1 Tax=unclassified Streptomyces TaxID=2593676 RepID=UPI00331FA744